LANAARDVASEPVLQADIDRSRARVEVDVGSALDAHRILMVATRAVADRDAGRALEMACAAELNRAHGADGGTTLRDDLRAQPLIAGDDDTPSTARCMRRAAPRRAAIRLAVPPGWRRQRR
jgi:hypothetical protein